MAESQEEKIKKIFARNGIKIQEVVDKLFPNAKGSYYTRVRKTPLDKEFIDQVKAEFSIDLVAELKKSHPEESLNEIEELRTENQKLKDELLDLSRQLIELLKNK